MGYDRERVSLVLNRADSRVGHHARGRAGDRRPRARRARAEPPRHRALGQRGRRRSSLLEPRSEAAQAFRALADARTRRRRRQRANAPSARRRLLQEEGLMELHERLATVAAGRRSSAGTDPFAEVKNRDPPRRHRRARARSSSTPTWTRSRCASACSPTSATTSRSETGIARDDRERLADEIADDILGHGPLERLLADDTVTEIMVNGPFDVWVERQGRLYETTVRFNDESHLRRIINKIVAQVGRRIDESSPMVDARLPDGSRVNAIIPPLSLTGPLRDDPQVQQASGWSSSDLVRLGTLSAETVEFLQRCVVAELNILISGGTGSGKTTLLNALSTAIPDERPHRHDRGRGRAAAQPAARAPARGAAEEHRGRGRDPDPRAGAQLAAHAPRPDHRRRGPRRRGARHAPGDEHGPRRLALARCTRTRRATRSRASRRWC